MKFIENLKKAYSAYSIEEPAELKEQVGTIPSVPAVATPATAAVVPSTTKGGTDTLKKNMEVLAKIKTDPEMAKRTQELEKIYQQVATALKKEADLLKAKSTDILAGTNKSITDLSKL